MSKKLIFALFLVLPYYLFSQTYTTKGVEGGALDGFKVGGQDPEIDDKEPSLLFKSGFEQNVFIDNTVDPYNKDYRYISGLDKETNFSWPLNILGSTNSGLHYIADDNHQAVYAELQNVIGHNGDVTTALFQKENYEFNGATQCPYEILNIVEGKKDLYIKFWMKIDRASLHQPNKWRAIFEYKTKDYDLGNGTGTGYRLIAFIYTDKNGNPYWHFQGDENPLNPIWEISNFDLPVPENEWFSTEFYWKWSDNLYGRTLWKINGNVIADHHGATTRNSKPIDFIILSTIYGNANPKHQWIDDIEIWDGIPEIDNSTNIGECAPITSMLTTSSISNNNAYIYTPQPNGAVNNQFRYRPIGSDIWKTTNISTNYYRYLSDLLSGTQYEFQVSQACGDGSYSEFSAAYYFTTTGANQDGENEEENGSDSTNSGNCVPISGNLTTSSISNNNAYIYTPQPNGAVNNQFRYRPIGSDIWKTTNISTNYYRYLSDLLSGTQYEFQVSQACGDGSYSEFSAASYFTTSGEVLTGGELANRQAVAPDYAIQKRPPMKNQAITIYPNPAVSSMTVSLESRHTRRETIFILDITGRVVQTNEVTLEAGRNNWTFSLVGIPYGSYFVKVGSGNESEWPVQKLIILQE